MAPGLIADDGHGSVNRHHDGDRLLPVHGASVGVNANGSADSTATPSPTSQSTNNGLDHAFPPNGRPVEPVAIVGMAMRLPGGVHNAESFWDLLVNKRSGHCRVPSSRYNVDAWYGPGKLGHVGTHGGYFLEDLNLAHMDASFWSMSKSEASVVDPQQRLMLEVVYECLENSGAKDWRGKKIGCYVGIFGEDWADMDGKDAQNSNLYRGTGYGDYITANRVSYEFDFKGPSMTIRTACSSSLTGLHEAVQALYSGECTSAIVGGSNLILTPRMTVAMAEMGVLSQTGSCKTFDADADGYGRGEAVSALYIKKLSDAIRDGDPVRAVIRSTCVNNDGKTMGLTSPNTEAHEALIRRGHQLAGLHDLSKTAMIECHGTGTKVGDPIEAKAVANVFGKTGVYIGSVKPNLGHSEGASGISSIMKMVLALEHKTIPPNMNLTKRNPDIPWEAGNLRVPVNPTPWPIDRAERVGVNSFGIGGANAHVVLESAACHGIRPSTPATEPDDRPALLLFSAKHPESVRRSVQNHASYLASHPESLYDMGHTLVHNREWHPHRGFCVVQAGDDLEASPIQKSETTPKLIFTFTGQGAQWAGMGKELFVQEPKFADSIAKLDAVLSSLPEPPSWTLRDEILKPESKSRLSEAEFSQPCCTALQVALVDLLARWGVNPAGVVGHSSGEIGAAYAAQTINAREAILIAYYRGMATLGLQKLHRGGMAAVGLGRQEVTPYLRSGVVVGCENSPESVTLTGDLDILEDIMVVIRKDRPNVLVRALHVECAYHSPHMESVAGKYQTLLGKSIHGREPTVPFFSSVTEGSLRGETLSTSYWIRNMTSPVLFLGAINAALDEIKAPLIFLELGAHAALAGPVRQIFRQRSSDAQYVSTLVRNTDGLKSLLTTAGELWVRKATMDLGNINPGGHLLTSLPTYAWNYEDEYWHESRLSKETRHRKFAHHDILGSRVVESCDLDPLWRNLLRLDQLPWIEDHNIAGNVLFPAAGYIAMAGEALRQMEGGVDYTVRTVNFKSALIINEGKPVETQTHLRKSQLTTSLDSEWYDFSIASLNEGSWTKHCVGQVKKGPTLTTTAPTIEHFPRQVPSSVWYRILDKLGYRYGPRFQGLHGITAHVRQSRAAATLFDGRGEGESPYQLHPTTIDSAFQLAGLAACNGVGRVIQLRKLVVPTYIEEMYISPANDPIALRVNGKFSSSGAVTSDMAGVSAGQIVFELKGFLQSPLGDSNESNNDDPHAATEMVWKSDANLLDAAQLIRPSNGRSALQPLLERLALACLIESNCQLLNCSTSKPHLERFRNWLGMQQASAVQDRYPEVSDGAAIAGMDSKRRVHFIEEILAEAGETDVAAEATAIHRIQMHSAKIFDGTTDALNVLMEDNLLTRVHDGIVAAWDDVELFELLGHCTPNMKILEIGAGTGGTTGCFLRQLRSANGERRFGSYTYTNTSAGFFAQAKERFRDLPGVDFQVLDVSQDPLAQGFEAGSFDLIVATNVLHATPVLKEALSNVRALLHPRGRLFLQELAPTTKWVNLVMGVLPGWWLGEGDGRPTEPYVHAERWITELRDAGFADDPSIIHDGYMLNTIVARPAVGSKPKRVAVLHVEESGPRTEEFVRRLAKEGYELDFCTIGQPPTADQDIISLLDVESPFLASATEADFAALQSFITHCQGTGLLWITKAAQVDCRDPDYSLILGMARSIRNELGMKFATCELDDLDSADSLSAMVKVLGEFRLHHSDSDHMSDLEYAYADGRIQISRVNPVKVSKQLETPIEDCQPKKLAIDRPGILQSLNWRQCEPEDVDGDQVAIDVKAVGLNFRDVLSSMGIIEVLGRGPGYESSGIVTKAGPTTKHLKVGDRIICSNDGSFSTTSSSTELCCAKIPDDLSFLDAATMPVVYGTVIYGLMDVARLARGQTVLIHSAAGGVGIAAIQIAQMIGAEIYCTVSSQEKIDYVQRNFDIPGNRILYSRDASFLSDILRETNGKGVDVVLNSLSGELLHASWKCVAEFGTMVEIGKRDLMGHATLSMTPFLDNRTFAGVDLSRVCVNQPAIMHDLLRRVIQFYTQGHIKPISPIKVYQAAQVEDAMRYMQKGQHIGKIVVGMPEKASELAATPTAKKLSLRPDVSYLFVGGLGGLGRSIASWLVENGARHLVFLSRSAGQVSGDDPFVKELAAQECSVQTFSGSVANAADVARVVASSTAPIAGVLQASMVLNDVSWNGMTFEKWQAAVLPKVQGTWNLHREFLKRDQPLDFFFLFSSISGLFGQPGQANYAAGNTFLDAFVQYRHSLGLPASVLDIGVMEDIGYVSTNAGLLDSFKSSSVHLLHEQDLLDSIQLMIERSSPANSTTSMASPSLSARTYVNHSQIAIGVRSSNATNNRAPWKRDARMAVFEGGTDTGSGGSDLGRLKQLLSECRRNPAALDLADSINLLAQEAATTLGGFMMRGDEQLDLNVSMATLGVDSLVSIELRNWFRQKVGVDISVLEVVNSGSLTALAEHAATKLKEKFQARGG
ncbi:MAG: hypothetical protein Q9169_006904 [Polycauliona sp. 2 TL-2023]